MEERKYDLEQEAARFRPLVLATARRYTGRGADFDDLVQEGYLALLQLVPGCPRPELLPLYLKKRLPGRVRTAAKREWRQEAFSLECLEGTEGEPAVPPERAAEENSLEKYLNEKERHLAALLIDGNSQKEAAASLGVTQQAVSARIGRMRKKLESFR